MKLMVVGKYGHTQWLAVLIIRGISHNFCHNIYVLEGTGVLDPPPNVLIDFIR